MQFIVTRPEHDAADLSRAIEALGHHAIGAPLLSMRATGLPLAFDGVQAVIATSRNGLRVLADGPHLREAIALPLFVVGAASAAKARRLGFAKVIAGDSGARELPALIARDCRGDGGTLLYLSGDVLAFDLEPSLRDSGFTVRRQVVYEAVEATDLPDNAVAAIRGAADDETPDVGVLLMSRRSAQVFMRLTRQHGLAVATPRLGYICMSPAVAQGLGEPLPARLLVADRPTSEEMLALVKELASNSGKRAH